MKNNKSILFLSSFLPIIFLPSLPLFFSGDDWFHLRVSQISSLTQFINFFSFVRNAQSIAFYRPLSTQVFFFVFQRLFDLNPLPYHLFVLFCFGVSLYLVGNIAASLLKSRSKTILCLLIYGVSVSNFTRVYFLSAFQEIALVIFACLCIRSYLGNHFKKSLLYFILALLSKETAVVLPLIFIFLDWSDRRTNLKKILPFLVVLLPYLYFRLFIFGNAVGDTYQWNFSPLKAVNTLIWYFLWSLGAPELLIDYIGSGFRPIPRFFTDYPFWWPIIIGFLFANLGLLVTFFFKSIHRINRKFIGMIFLFIVSLLPVLFLPDHKFALELGLPLIWFAIGVAWLLPEKGKLSFSFLVFFAILNLSMNYLTYTRHYSVGRASISEKIYEYFLQQYPSEPKGSYFEFINDTHIYVSEWGSSRQIANTTGGSELFRVLYKDPKYLVYFEDLPGTRPTLQRIPVSSKMFLQ